MDQLNAFLRGLSSGPMRTHERDGTPVENVLAMHTA